jgi:phosphatidylglycerophosphate synthase
MSTTTLPAPSRPFTEAARLQTSVLAAAERRTLLWLAERMPARVHSDHLTMLALAAMAGAGLSYWLARTDTVGLVLATVCLAANWFGDSLDGTLARVRRQPRPRYGYYVDHVVDVVGTLFLLGGLALSGYMSVAVSAALLVAYYLVCLEVYLATHSLGQFRMSFLGIGPTELRIVMAIGNVALIVHPNASLGGHTFRLFDVGGVVAATGLAGTFVYSSYRNTRALYAAEPLPERPPR